jgi:hypothetical protein
LPAVEAAIADRIEREIAPLLKNAYAGPSWGLAAGDRVYPYAAAFANPDTSSFTGTSTNTAGLLPLVHNESSPGSLIPCTSGASNPRCNPNLVTWSNAAPAVSYTNIVLPVTSACSYAGPTGFASCNGTYAGIGAAPRITVSGPQSNGAMSLRATNAVTGFVVFWDPLAVPAVTITQPVPSVTLNSNGTFTVSLSATPPAPFGVSVVSWWIFVPGNATSDHALLDSSTSSSTGWFIRNEWHKLVYYAMAPGYAASAASPRSCTTGTTCLSATNLTPAGGQRAMLILAGRSINGSARPSTQAYPTPALSDYLDFGNAAGSFEKQPVSSVVNATLKAPFNDRLVVIDTN